VRAPGPAGRSVKQLLARAPLPRLDYAPLLARAAAGMAAEHEARARRDHRYFQGQAAALKRLAWAEEQKAQAKRENRHFAYPWAPVEFVWEAYFYLRKREGPGTPLPTKRGCRRHSFGHSAMPGSRKSYPATFGATAV
jgi:hypothetical protein